MGSTVEQTASRKNLTRRASDVFEMWNRKLHYYLGLYLLFFLWLFSFTGLLLNHRWTFAEFWPNRKQTKFERQIQPPPPGNDLDRANDLIRQLGLRGEIEWTGAPQPPGRLEFRLNRPGHMFDIKTDLESGRATVEWTRINFWGVIRVLHTFTGVRMNEPRMQRDWALTTIWALSMDALAVGLVLLVFSSYYMWYGLKQKRRLGLFSLGLGLVSCGFFLVGLGWLY